MAQIKGKEKKERNEKRKEKKQLSIPLHHNDEKGRSTEVETGNDRMPHIAQGKYYY
ncbi:uncharacterized protein ARB_05839 [Trichophyton benhamiae CBS 112371]|uniref:Uncharacterized protein n=1 Tax=Arthroderma benhamiae (strain ATCC MYA-4681 / CBS 112371) TaxID=663331 RepID=D4ANM2_ARTBC|nr:uncharacterized protein ARB_05839 [Trichophyton benhamiae CBS 112371]EFE34883.1 hypothetical protein ARB_05839 [Trichophyton benhamiae CBS 112371]